MRGSEELDRSAAVEIDADLARALEAYHGTFDDFARGNPEPIKVLYSHADDAVLANPFGPAVRGWRQISEALDHASSRFREGDVPEIRRVASYVGRDVACIHEVERWRAKVSGRDEIATFVLRVTSTFRREDGAWKLVHRHADPITTPHPDGPLRGTYA